VSRIASQDEAVYGREAIEMAVHGHYLTPAYLGRYVMNKPPLLQILSAVSVRVFGVSAWVVRLPSLIAAAAITTLLFLLAWRLHSFWPAVAAVLLLDWSHLFYVFARLCMTDMLLTLWLTVAMFVLMRDPSLERGSSFWIFSIASGAAILTKAAAGALPLLALMFHAVVAPRKSRPPLRRAVAVIAAAAGVALPWHLYELLVHSRWFITEYLLTAHLQVGVAAPPQYSNENHFVFYLRRMLLMDPVLTIGAAFGLIPLIRYWRRQTVLTAWVACPLLALFLFRYRSAYYLLPLIPPLALVATGALHRLPGRAMPAALAVLALFCGWKTISGSPVSGIPALAASQQPAAPALEHYCELHRGNGLVLVDSNDQFYASILPIARVRYAMLQPEPPSPPIDYGWLGIWMTAAQFADLQRWIPLYRSRLESFHLRSDQAVGTVIWANSPNDIASIIRAHPESDFYVPSRWAGQLQSDAHTLSAGGAGRVFLLSKTASRYYEPRGCYL
jgi:hypothetical protein